MTWAILVFALSVQAQVSTGAPPPPRENVPEMVAAEPDIVLRGRATRIVVTGDDPEALKAIELEPPDGVAVLTVTPLPRRANGSHAVALDLQISATAAPGERTLITLRKLEMSTSSSKRPGAPNDELSRQLDAFFDALPKDRVEGGALYVNSHELAVVGVAVEGDLVSVTIEDSAGDLQASADATSPPSGGGLAALRSSSDAVLVSQARCGSQVTHNVLDDVQVKGRRGRQTMVVAELFTLIKGDCELRVRGRDAAGNVTPWFSTKLTRR